jgi:hypothetical protein
LIACASLLFAGALSTATLAWKISEDLANRNRTFATPTEPPRIQQENSLVTKNSIDPPKSHPIIDSDSSGSAPDKLADNYDSVVSKIKQQVLADTINPSSAEFCPRFEIIPNKRGNTVYVGWYTSADLLGEKGKDNIIAEVDSSGNVVKLKIGDF